MSGRFDLPSLGVNGRRGHVMRNEVHQFSIAFPPHFPSPRTLAPRIPCTQRTSLRFRDCEVSPVDSGNIFLAS